MPNRVVMVFIFITAMMDSIGFGLILPVLPDLLIDITGADLSSAAIWGGWLMFAFAVTQFFFAPLLGNLSDAFGRRPLLLLSILLLASNYIIMGFAESLWLLFVGRLATGVGSATYSICNAYIADVTLPEERARYFGLTGAAFGLGFVVGPVIGGLLGDFGPRMPFFAAAMLLALNLLLGFFALPESLRQENRRPFNWRSANPFSTFRRLSEFRLVSGLLGVIFLYNLGHHVLPSTWSYYGIERFGWSPGEIGYSLGFIGILMVFTQGYLIRHLLTLFGLRRSAIFGFCMIITAFIGYAMATEGWMMYVAMIPGALGGIVGPAMNGIASAQLGPDRQGELQGGLASLMSLSSIISPPVMTLTFSHFAVADTPWYFPGAAFVMAALLTLFALLLFLRATDRSPGGLVRSGSG